MSNPNWGTPPEIAKLVRCMFPSGFCAPYTTVRRNRVVGAAEIFTAEDAIGFDSRWPTFRLQFFVNPPGGEYRQAWKQVCRHATSQPGFEFIWLAYMSNHLRTLQQEGERVLRACSVCIPKERIKFLDENGVPASTPNYDNAILYHGPNHEKFHVVFRELGTIWKGEEE